VRHCFVKKKCFFLVVTGGGYVTALHFLAMIKTLADQTVRFLLPPRPPYVKNDLFFAGVQGATVVSADSKFGSHGAALLGQTLEGRSALNVKITDMVPHVVS
jgi:hypothetical protein